MVKKMKLVFLAVLCIGLIIGCGKSDSGGNQPTGIGVVEHFPESRSELQLLWKKFMLNSYPGMKLRRLRQYSGMTPDAVAMMAGVVFFSTMTASSRLKIPVQ